MFQICKFDPAKHPIGYLGITLKDEGAYDIIKLW